MKKYLGILSASALALAGVFFVQLPVSAAGEGTPVTINKMDANGELLAGSTMKVLYCEQGASIFGCEEVNVLQAITDNGTVDIPGSSLVGAWDTTTMCLVVWEETAPSGYFLSSSPLAVCNGVNNEWTAENVSEVESALNSGIEKYEFDNNTLVPDVSYGSVPDSWRVVNSADSSVLSLENVPFSTPDPVEPDPTPTADVIPSSTPRETIKENDPDVKPTMDPELAATPTITVTTAPKAKTPAVQEANKDTAAPTTEKTDRPLSDVGVADVD